LCCARSPVRRTTLARFRSPSGSFSVRRVALYWLPARPPRRSNDLGVFLVGPCSARFGSHGASLVGFWSSSEHVGLRPPPARPLRGSAGPPLVRFLLPATHYAGCPSPRELPLGRSRGVRIARPSPVPSSGISPLSTVSAGSRLSPWPTRRFAVLFHTARVRGAPLQSFPSPRSRSRSRGPLLPCGFVVRSSPGAEPPGSS